MSAWLVPGLWLENRMLAQFWQNLQLAVQRDDVLVVSVIFLVATAILAGLARSKRTQVRSAFSLFAASLFLIVLSAAPATFGWPAAAKSLRAVGLLLGGFAIIKLASLYLFDTILPFTPFCPSKVVQDILVAIGYAGVGLWLLSRIGVTLSGIVTTSAVMTAVIVFSLQDSLSNILGGLVLHMERALNVGDWVKIDQTSGQIKQVTWRYVAIETRNWDTVIIPNSVLMKSQVLVAGRRSGQPLQERRWLYFNVDFRVPPTEVIRVVTEALQADPVEGAAADPKPNCLLMEFKESYCLYAVRYWLADLAKDDPTDSLVRTRIYFALQRAGIPLSVPAYTTFVEARDQERQKLHHEREIQQRLVALNLARVELFQTMNEEERRKLVERLRFTPFTKGEVMTRQGAEAHWLYILTKGSAEVVVSLDGGEHKQVSMLRAGDFFGEMSLLTGAPRTATVRALEDAECYRLDRDAFNDILRDRPEITQHLSEVLARRQVELEAVRHDLDAAAQAKMMQHQQRSIFDRIYKMFGLSHTTKEAGSRQ
ncbi:MAG: mechanosensitive ion channel family protein [Terriglobia bacterium]|jgi:small-conductance mechanosensitive channel/CRP-like cAMP-binding protein